MSEELKPCPCGADLSIEGLSPSWEWELGPTGERTGRKEWTVWCASCGRKVFDKTDKWEERQDAKRGGQVMDQRTIPETVGGVIVCSDCGQPYNCTRDVHICSQGDAGKIAQTWSNAIPHESSSATTARIRELEHRCSLAESQAAELREEVERLKANDAEYRPRYQEMRKQALKLEAENATLREQLERQQRAVTDAQLIGLITWLHRVVHCSHDGPKDNCSYEICKNATLICKELATRSREQEPAPTTEVIKEQ